ADVDLQVVVPGGLDARPAEGGRLRALLDARSALRRQQCNCLRHGDDGNPGRAIARMVERDDDVPVLDAVLETLVNETRCASLVDELRRGAPVRGLPGDDDVVEVGCLRAV